MKIILKHSIFLLLFLLLTVIVIFYNYIDRYYDQFDTNIEITDKYLIEAQQKIKNNGINPEMRLLLADGYKMAGQYDIAIKMFDELIQEDKRAYMGLALTYIREKDYKNVIKNIDLFLKYPHTLDNLPSQARMGIYLLLYKEKARAHWKLHQYIEWAKVFPKSNYLDKRIPIK